jgi:hypothetical protein
MKEDRPGTGESFSPMRGRTTVGGELTSEDDVEGHGSRVQGPETRSHVQGPETRAHVQGPRTREGREDDVEGHGSRVQGPETRSHVQGPETRAHVQGPRTREGGEDDVEGQSLIVDPSSAREPARARDRDVVRQVEHNRLEQEPARRPLKPKSR